MNNSRLNWLRAGVLGANDGIISVSVVLVSVIGLMTADKVLLVGLSVILAGALSMAVGEYVSVSAQKDAERAHNAAELTNPFHAALSSFLAFVAGSLVPLAAALILQSQVAVIVSVFIALIITTIVSTQVGKSDWKRPMVRNLVGGGIALTAALILNSLFGM